MTEKRGKPLHYWRWRSARYLLACGARNGLIDVHAGPEAVTCKGCLRVARARGWIK